MGSLIRIAAKVGLPGAAKPQPKQRNRKTQQQGKQPSPRWARPGIAPSLASGLGGNHSHQESKPQRLMSTPESGGG
jgi:hypothetical protein